MHAPNGILYMTSDEVFAAIKAGEMSNESFKVWLEEQLDQAFENGYAVLGSRG